jgi:hypothetical protein
MVKILICYRREDGEYPAYLIYKGLSDHFGSESDYFDVDTIQLVTEYHEYHKNQISEYDILLAVIGDQWVETLEQRVGDPKDFVQIEIKAALNRDIPIVPILVGQALAPDEKQLPPELVGLFYRNAVEVRDGPDLANQLKHLIKELERLIADRDVKVRPRPQADENQKQGIEEVKQRVE